MTISLDNVIKRFGEQVVVNNVSLDIHEGELFVLLGSSGSGKSTVLRVIAGLVMPDQGTVKLRGRDVTHVKPQKREVGFVFQNYALFKHLTVIRNIEFGLKIRGVPKGERHKRALELLELVGLTGLGERYPHQLSGGQSQRVALARALAYRPSVLLLDEPFGALDVKIRGRLRRSLKALQKQLGVTTVLVTHDQEEAFELADRIAVVERGRIVEVGTPHELYYSPKSEFTANFVGGGNVLFGRCHSGYVKLGEALMVLPSESQPHSEGAPVRVLSRPEWVQYARSTNELDDTCPILGAGTVRDRLFVGSSEKIRFELNDLRGSQSIGLSYDYGQTGTLLDSLTSTAGDQDRPSVGEQRTIALRRYHILQPSSLRILSSAPLPSENVAVLETAAALASASYGQLTVLGTESASDTVSADSRPALDSIVDLSERWRDMKVDFKRRTGSPVREVVLESQEGYYDMVVLPCQSTSSGQRSFTDAARHVLSNARIPVLLVSERRTLFERVLISTAGGEPGMADVRFAARMCRHTGAPARVFHARPVEADDAEFSRLNRHFERASALLTSFDISNDSLIRIGDPIQELVREIEEGEWDLLVLGAPGRSLLLDRYQESFNAMVLSRTEIPILIVPTPD